jgi:arsenate reductase
LSKAKCNRVFDFFREGRLYDYVITVCGEAAAGQCPVFPGITKRFHWPFKDPEELTGTHEEKLESLREIRNQIREKVIDWFITLS